MRPRAKLSSERAAVAAVALAASTFAVKSGIDRHVAVARQIEEALGEVGIVGGERGIDLARRHRGIERARDRVVGERRRIVLIGQQRLRLKAARRNGERGNGQGHGQAERHGDPGSGHQGVSSAPPQFHQAQLRAQEAALGNYPIAHKKLSDCSQKERRGGRRQFQKTVFYPRISAIYPRNRLAAPVWCRACGCAGFTGPAKV